MAPCLLLPPQLHEGGRRRDCRLQAPLTQWSGMRQIYTLHADNYHSTIAVHDKLTGPLSLSLPPPSSSLSLCVCMGGWVFGCGCEFAFVHSQDGLCYCVNWTTPCRVGITKPLPSACLLLVRDCMVRLSTIVCVCLCECLCVSLDNRLTHTHTPRSSTHTVYTQGTHG